MLASRAAVEGHQQRRAALLFPICMLQCARELAAIGQRQLLLAAEAASSRSSSERPLCYVCMHCIGTGPFGCLIKKPMRLMELGTVCASMCWRCILSKDVM